MMTQVQRPLHHAVIASPIPLREIGEWTTSAPIATPIHADQAWLTLTMIYLIPIFSLVAALFAAWFSGRSLVYIKKQIKLANDQIELGRAQTKIAQDGLKLALQEFKATIEVLEITKNQAKFADDERARIPELRLLVNGAYPPTTIKGQGSHRFHQEDKEKIYFELCIKLANTGSKIASAVSVDIIIPDEWDDNSASQGYGQPNAPIYYFNEYDERGKKFGKRDIPKTIVPTTDAYIGVICASAKPGKYVLEWVAKTEQGFFVHPNENSYGNYSGAYVSLEEPCKSMKYSTGVVALPLDPLT